MDARIALYETGWQATLCDSQTKLHAIHGSTHRSLFYVTCKLPLSAAQWDADDHFICARFQICMRQLSVKIHPTMMVAVARSFPAAFSQSLKRGPTIQGVQGPEFPENQRNPVEGETIITIPKGHPHHLLITPIYPYSPFGPSQKRNMPPRLVPVKRGLAERGMLTQTARWPSHSCAGKLDSCDQ